MANGQPIFAGDGAATVDVITEVRREEALFKDRRLAERDF